MRPQVRRDHSPALTWLSLVGLLPSRAQLRFTRQGQVYQDGIGDEEVHGCEISGYGWCCEDIVPPEKPTAVQLKTILNHVEPYKSFVYKKARWADPETKTTIEIPIEPRANGRAICSGCGQPAPGYDRLAERRFEFVPLWQIAVFFVYAMRRVECPKCGVKVEQVPWCDGKNQLTTTYRWFLAGWAKRLSWKGVAEAFGTTWQNVFRSVKHAVSWGLAHRNLEGIEAIGVDEVQWQKGHKYLTLVYQIDAGLQAAVVDRPGPDGQDVFAVLPHAGQRAFGPAEVHLQRHVEAVPEGDRQEGSPGDSRARPVSHHAEDEQGDRRGPGRRGQANEGRRLRAGPQALAVVSVEAAGEPDRQTDGEAVGAVEVQSSQRAGVSAEGGLSAVLGIRQPRLGGEVPRPVVHADDAFEARTDEEGCPQPYAATAS